MNVNCRQSFNKSFLFQPASEEEEEDEELDEEELDEDEEELDEEEEEDEEDEEDEDEEEKRKLGDVIQICNIFTIVSLFVCN